MSRDPHEVLGVDPDASEAELKAAYRKAARAWHPDRNPAPEAEARFKEIAAAWEILRDPAARRRHRLTSARAERGELPEEFLLDVADAIERAEIWIREAVLPHYARWYRGHGAELATRLLADLDELVVPRSLAPASWWRRRAVSRRIAPVQVTVLFGWSRDLSVIRQGRGLVEILLLPQALWDRGFRDSLALDDAVMRLLIARFAQVVGPALAPAADGSWDEVIASARRADGARVLQTRLRWAGWTAVAALIAAMLTAAIQNW